jgi:hypothetical protein
MLPTTPGVANRPWQSPVKAACPVKSHLANLLRVACIKAAAELCMRHSRRGSDQGCCSPGWPVAQQLHGAMTRRQRRSNPMETPGGVAVCPEIRAVERSTEHPLEHH